MKTEPVHPADGSTLSGAPVTGPAYTVERCPLLGAGPHRAAWERLHLRALEPNAFFAPWFVEADARRAGDAAEVELLLVYHRPAKSAPELVALLPFVERRRFRGLPLLVIEVRVNEFTPLGTPLIDRDHADAALAELFDWLERSSGAHAFVLPMTAGDGPFHHRFVDQLRQRALPHHTLESYSRGLLRRRGEDGEAYLNQAFAGGKGRKKLRAKERHLAQLGALTFDALEPNGELGRWTEEFLALEQRGWKGKDGTAMASSLIGRAFFEEVAREASTRGQLMMLALRIDGRPVAMKFTLLDGRGAFAYKIAYDEAVAAHSPGMQLELENVRRFFAMHELGFMDSCADPGSRMFTEVWIDRLTIHNWVCSTGRAPGGLLVSALPLLRWASQAVRRLRPARA
jgi:CelD/BcsL family acetyltransferase involved in cellulose biosynthesis